MVCEGIRRLRARGCKHLVRAAQIVAEIDAADRLRHKGALTKSLERLEAIYETHVEKDAALLHTRQPLILFLVGLCRSKLNRHNDAVEVLTNQIGFMKTQFCTGGDVDGEGSRLSFPDPDTAAFFLLCLRMRMKVNRKLKKKQPVEEDEALIGELGGASADSLYRAGCVCVKLKEGGESIAVLNECIAVEPTHIGAVWMKGLAYEVDGKTDMALRQFTQVIEYGVDADLYETDLSLQVLTQRALVYHRTGKLLEGLQDLQTALTQDATFVDAMYLKADIFLTQTKLVPALSELRKATTQEEVGGIKDKTGSRIAGPLVIRWLQDDAGEPEEDSALEWPNMLAVGELYDKQLEVLGSSAWLHFFRANVFKALGNRAMYFEHLEACFQCDQLFFGTYHKEQKRMTSVASLDSQHFYSEEEVLWREALLLEALLEALRSKTERRERRVSISAHSAGVMEWR